MRDQDWIRRNVPAGCRVDVRDVTSSYAVLGVMGPRSRELLARLTDADLGEEGFPFATSRLLALAGADVRATRMTYVGELGWELMVPVDAAAGVYDALVGGGRRPRRHERRLLRDRVAAAGEGVPGLRPRADAGLHAGGGRPGLRDGLDKCDARGEPLDFLGRAALAAHRDRLRAGGPRRRLVSFVVRDTEPMLWGGELVLRDGEPVGQVTSAAWGETVGASVGLAYVRRDEPVTSRLAGGGRLPRRRRRRAASTYASPSPPPSGDLSAPEPRRRPSSDHPAAGGTGR